MWYDVNNTLSHNCLFNFVIGNRSCGKTYGCKKKAVDLFKKKKHQFVYLRRYESELMETAESYFNDIIVNGEFPDDEIVYKNGCYFLNGEVMGYAMALTKAKDYKSIAYPLVYFIIFDEFLIEENGYARYLKNEVEQFLNFYMSIDRYRGTTVMFLANSVSMINPYTLYWDLRLPYGSNITKKGDVLLQLVQDEGFINERKNTRFGKLVEGTPFSDYAIENKFVNDSNTFIARKTAKAFYRFTFIYKGESFGVWLDYDVGKMFVSENIDKSCKVVYSFTVDDHNPNTMLLKSVNKSYHVKELIENYKLGLVYFESQKIKNIVYEVIRLCLM